ncbi:MAG: endonuclease MutS2 [Oscillospiraceae bacterium]|nr:endonuclease MutS2 [Oscillospiraceae bacterium]
MMNLYEKSINTLELPAVLELLAAEAVSPPAKEAAMELRPGNDAWEISRRLSETTAAKNMVVIKGAPALSGIRDVRGSVTRADMGGMLNTRELLDIAGLLKSARTTVSYASGDMAEPGCLGYLFSSLHANRYLEDRIYSTILSEDEIADSASRELSDIRRSMRVASERIRSTLQRIISSPAYSKVLQEAIITMRNDRYVVPVKAEHKSAVPGLVHDRSSSGATLFIEPMSAVEANNEIRELQAKEKNEIDRILMTLSAEVANSGEDIINDYNVLVELDLVFAKGKLAWKQEAAEPELSDNGVINLKQARHPLLPRKTAVPIDIELGGDFDSLVITGPNTGGKTVSLKTLGLICLMAQCGLQIPAREGSCVPVFDRILADIGDEQSIEQSLSTFSAHMKNIVMILEECGPDTLILFDELGAGTDPVEGAALAVSVIEYARNRGANIAATTHYSELKLYATTTKGVQNASCEFDVETLRPTYRLLIGIPGKSNAFAISSRLGLPDEIIEDARGRISSDNASFEEVLEHLERTRQEMEREKLEIQQKLGQISENEKVSRDRRIEVEKEKEKAAVIARREANEIIEDARRTAEEVFRSLNKMRKEAGSGEDWQKSNEARAEIRRMLNQAEEKTDSATSAAEKETPASRPPKAGDTVEILSIGTKAQVISVNQDGTLNLQAGIMKISAKAEEVRVVENAAAKQVKKLVSSASVSSSGSQARPELDLRGMMSDEAVAVLDKYIDTARMGHLNTVTVIHGKGTGALRQAVHRYLRSCNQIKSFRLGRFGEGESGVTIVELK